MYRPLSLRPSATLAWWYGKTSASSNHSSGHRMAIRMNYSGDGVKDSVEAELVVTAIGWIADIAGLNLPVAGIETNARGYIGVDAHLRTSAPHIYAAGDITGRWMLVPQAIQDGWIAATNAVQGNSMTVGRRSLSNGRLHGPRVRQRGLDGDEGARGARSRSCGGAL